MNKHFLIVLLMSALFTNVGLLSCTKNDVMQGQENEDISKENLYIKGFVDGCDAILTGKGYIAVFRDIEGEVEQTSEIENHTIVKRLILNQIDPETSKVIPNSAFIFELDDFGNVIRFCNEDEMYLFDYSNEGIIECLRAINGGTEFQMEQIEDGKTKMNLNLDSNLSKQKTANTKGETVIENGIKIINGSLASVELATALFDSPFSLRTALAALGYISSGVPGIAGTGLTVTEQELRAKFMPATTSVLSTELALIECGRIISDELTKGFIGNWSVSIDNVKRVSMSDINVSYTITGMKEKQFLKSACYVLLYCGNKYVSNIKTICRNGKYNMPISLQGEFGKCSVEVHLSASFGFFKIQKASIDVDEPKVETGEIHDITKNSAFIDAEFTNIYPGCRYGIEYWGKDVAYTINGNTDGLVGTPLILTEYMGGLKSGEEYKCQAFVEYNGQRWEGSIKEFKTKGESVDEIIGTWTCSYTDCGIPISNSLTFREDGTGNGVLFYMFTYTQDGEPIFEKYVPCTFKYTVTSDMIFLNINPIKGFPEYMSFNYKMVNHDTLVMGDFVWHRK